SRARGVSAAHKQLGDPPAHASASPRSRRRGGREQTSPSQRRSAVRRDRGHALAVGFTRRLRVCRPLRMKEEKTMRRITYLVGVVAMAAMMAWPVAAQQPAQMSAAVGDNMNHVPSFVGVEKGIFLKHGVDVKLKVLATGQQMSQALQAGGGRISRGGPPESPHARGRRLAG